MGVALVLVLIADTYPLRVSRSTIKYDHSDSVITYYTRWYAVHSIPTSYVSPLSLHHVTLNLVSRLFSIENLLAVICTSVSDIIQRVIMLYTGWCVLLLVHTLLLVNAFASSSVCSAHRCSALPAFFHTSKQVPTSIICVHKSDDTRKVWCSRCCLVMLCDFA